jgi:hypothetical protein
MWRDSVKRTEQVIVTVSKESVLLATIAETIQADAGPAVKSPAVKSPPARKEPPHPVEKKSVPAIV